MAAPAPDGEARGMTDAILLTPTGLAELEAEVEQLREACRSNGDGEGLEHERLARLEARLRAAEVVEPEQDGRVSIGERLAVCEVGTGAVRTYRIVGFGEGDPAIGEISYRSPVGAALVGRGVGDVVEVDIPSGRLRLEILALDG
jgi:transcription elongation GreA/GreB family factor